MILTQKNMNTSILQITWMGISSVPVLSIVIICVKIVKEIFGLQLHRLDYFVLIYRKRKLLKDIPWITMSVETL